MHEPRVHDQGLLVQESCVLDVKCGTVLIISSGRVLVFNCSLKARYLFCTEGIVQLYHRPEDRFEKARHPGCFVFLAQLEEAGQAKEFAASDIIEALGEYFLETLLDTFASPESGFAICLVDS